MYQSFMVRIWQEAGWASGNFQITVESVQTGQTHRFDNLTSLLDFLHAAVNFDNLKESGKESEEGNKGNKSP